MCLELFTRKKLENLYDAIILDEAHDYLPEEVELFSKLGSTLFAVADSDKRFTVERSRLIYSLA